VCNHKAERTAQPRRANGAAMQPGRAPGVGCSVRFVLLFVLDGILYNPLYPRDVCLLPKPDHIATNLSPTRTCISELGSSRSDRFLSAGSATSKPTGREQPPATAPLTQTEPAAPGPVQRKFSTGAHSPLTFDKRDQDAPFPSGKRVGCGPQSPYTLITCQKRVPAAAAVIKIRPSA